MARTMTTIAPSVLFGLLSVLLLVLSIPASASTRHLERDELTGHIASTREELLATRERRKEQFGGRFEEMKQQMEEHTTGQRLMNENEFNRLERKMKAYERKLEHLHTEIDDRHIDRLLDREAMLNEMHRNRLSKSEL
jgi:peptidoglycan hydrolase CwlO-like protein